MVQSGGSFRDFLGPVGLALDASSNVIGRIFLGLGITLTKNEVKVLK